MLILMHKAIRIKKQTLYKINQIKISKQTNLNSCKLKLSNILNLVQIIDLVNVNLVDVIIV